MARFERTSVSGTALSYLLYECVNSYNSQEGFLFGHITQDVTNHISDTRSDNTVVEVIINVTSVLPAPDIGLFYYPSGKIKEDVLQQMLGKVAGDVVGWYRYRKNNFLKPTMRDRIISKGLQKYFEKLNRRHFVYCNVTCKQTSSNSTHTFSYRFAKLNSYGIMENLPDVTRNLGESISGYKRALKADKNSPFDKAVMEACGRGAEAVTDTVRIALRVAADKAAQNEEALRKVSEEVRHMSMLLAEHHAARVATRQAALQAAENLEEERSLIEPLVQSLSLPSNEPEPFDFITELMKHEQTEKPSSQLNLLDDFPPLHGEMANSFTAAKDDTMKAVGHKRIHSEGAIKTAANEKGKSPHSRGWETASLPKSHSDQAT